MAFTHRVGVSYASADGSIAGVTSTYQGDAEGGFDGTVPGTTTNMEVDVSFQHDDIVALCLYSTKALTIKTNSSSAPDDTITLAAGVPLIWSTGDRGTNPFTDPVTKLFLTNAGAAEATVKLRWLLDSTP